MPATSSNRDHNNLNDNNPPPTAPQLSPFHSEYNPTSNDATSNITPNSPVDIDDYLTQEQRDELLARRLQEEEEENSTRYLNATSSSISSGQQQPLPQQQNNFTPIVTQATIVGELNNTHDNSNNNTNNNMDSEDNMTSTKQETDEEIARRLEREMNDEIYARQLQEYERCRRLQEMTSTEIPTRATASDIRRVQQNRQQANRSGW